MLVTKKLSTGLLESSIHSLKPLKRKHKHMKYETTKYKIEVKKVSFEMTLESRHV